MSISRFDGGVKKPDDENNKNNDNENLTTKNLHQAKVKAKPSTNGTGHHLKTLSDYLRSRGCDDEWFARCKARHLAGYDAFIRGLHDEVESEPYWEAENAEAEAESRDTSNTYERVERVERVGGCGDGDKNAD